MSEDVIYINYSEVRGKDFAPARRVLHKRIGSILNRLSCNKSLVEAAIEIYLVGFQDGERTARKYRE